MAPERRKITGPYEDEYGEYFSVPLTQGLEAKISRVDVERVGQYLWCASRESREKKWYAIRWQGGRGQRSKIRMHRFVLDQPPGSADGFVVDHIGHDSLDNRRERLEVITQRENMLRSEGWRRKRVEEPCL